MTEQEFDAELGRRLRAARQRLGMSQVELSRRSGVGAAPEFPGSSSEFWYVIARRLWDTAREALEESNG